MTIDLRSDTFTKPGQGMRDAMANAIVGDDVFGEDPTVNLLEELVADMLGAEAALFCPTATMCNQIAIKVHTNPMDEIITDRLSHIYNYEVGGYAYLSGCSIRLIETERGLLSADLISAQVNPMDVHKPISSLVCLENTCNKGGGSVYSFREIEAIKKVCLSNGMALHLDGSRLFNAVLTSGDQLKPYGKVFDSITICLSKGLGCPAGALLAGSKKTIEKARRVRKVFGGGMRQSGVLAAAGVYALEHNLESLRLDHIHARVVAETLQSLDYIDYIYPVETNIILFRIDDSKIAEAFITHINEKGILAFHLGEGLVRFVFHLDIPSNAIPDIQDALISFHTE